MEPHHHDDMAFQFANSHPQCSAAFEAPAHLCKPNATAQCSTSCNELFVGSYVPALEGYERGINSRSTGAACNSQYALVYAERMHPEMSAWVSGHADMFAGASGMSSRSLDVLSGEILRGGSAGFKVDRRDPFAGISIPEPRPVGYLEGVGGGQEVLTTNFNQTRDLRGDIPVTIHETPTSASKPTHSTYTMVMPYHT